MAELTTSQLIKILLGIFVVVVVVVGVFLFFRNTVIDFIKNLPGAEEIPGEEIGEEGEEETFDGKIDCESSGCTDKPPENLVCNILKTKVKGHYYKCTRKGDCVRTTFRKEVEECVYGCTEKELEGAECNACLSSGTEVKMIGNPHRSNCCGGYYCSNKGWFGICLEHKCN